MLALDDPIFQLERVARTYPRHIAIKTREGVTNYTEFLDIVRRFAAVIAPLGAEGRVLIALPQGVLAYAAMFGTLMGGACYAPVDIDAPYERQRLIRDSFKPDLIVTNREHQGQLKAGKARMLCVEDLPSACLCQPKEPSKLAYVMFTSGSTGVPKGVMVSREALMCYLRWLIPALNLAPGEICSQHPNLAFDVSLCGICGALTSGATLAPIIHARDRLLPVEAIRDLGITVWMSVPSVIDMMAKRECLDIDHSSQPRLFLLAGEVLLSRHLEAIFKAWPRAQVINAYGPTETTISVTEMRVHAHNYLDFYRQGLSIGQAIPGMTIDLLGGEAPDVGEIVISGPQLAEGYLDNPLATQAAFRQLPSGDRAYFSGDWAERIDDYLYFRHRIDRQVKVMGHRIELAEVDSTIHAVLAMPVQTVCVGGRYLVSFIESESERDLTFLRHSLRARLPSYAIPKDIRFVTRLPRNANDKIDVADLIRQAEESR